LSDDRQPAFLDKGKTVDSIQKAYTCESIEYENWEENDATDSCLTVCFINSTKAPAEDAGDSINPFKGIATAIKKSLAKPERYSSYNIVFIKKEVAKGVTTKNLTSGMKIPVTEL
jgi:hypothetical protein